jgi:phosphomannomutase
MVGDAVRDKDAVAATLLICEVCTSQSERKYRYKELLQLYVEHGFYKEYLVSITKRNRRIGR